MPLPWIVLWVPARIKDHQNIPMAEIFDAGAPAASAANRAWEIIWPPREAGRPLSNPPAASRIVPSLFQATQQQMEVDEACIGCPADERGARRLRAA
jgi:hypothetical protein